LQKLNKYETFLKESSRLEPEDEYNDEFDIREKKPRKVGIVLERGDKVSSESASGWTQTTSEADGEYK